MDVSVLMIAKFPSPHIKSALTSAVALSDEVILVVDPSGEPPPDWLSDFPVQLYFNKFRSYSSQRNEGLSHVTKEWVLNLDSDEIITRELRDEIKNLDSKYNVVYELRMTTFVWGRPLRRVFSYRTYARLHPATVGWSNDVHERLNSSGYNRVILSGRIMHYTVDGLEHWVKKHVKYARLESKSSGGNIAMRLLLRPVRTFVKHYLIGLGFLDGLAGFIMCILLAYYEFMIGVFVWEKSISEKTD